MDLAPDFDEFIGSLIAHGAEFLSGVSWDDAWHSRAAGMCGGHPVAYLGREMFLQNKRASGRPKDLADVDALEPGQDS
jgi:hypothetical protein